MSVDFDEAEFDRVYSLARTFRNVVSRYQPTDPVHVLLYSEHAHQSVDVEPRGCFDTIAAIVDECEASGTPVRALSVGWFPRWTWTAPGWRKHPRDSRVERRTSRMREALEEDWL